MREIAVIAAMCAAVCAVGLLAGPPEPASRTPLESDAGTTTLTDDVLDGATVDSDAVDDLRPSAAADPKNSNMGVTTDSALEPLGRISL